MTTVCIFAGQGAEEPGMGVELAAASADARAWLDEASRVTGIDVPRALERGARALSQTDVLQPVLMAVGLASVANFEGAPDVVAGHSLGELTAACWAASLAPSVALELGAARGRAMAEAADIVAGGMLAVRGTSATDLEVMINSKDACRELSVAAINTPDEIVVSGERAALNRLAGELPGRCTHLRVAGAWHSRQMSPVVEPFRVRLRAAFTGCELRAPVISSCRVGEVAIDELPDVLADSIVRPVRFLDAVRHMERAGIVRALIPEPSRSTGSLLRRAASRAWTIAS